MNDNMLFDILYTLAIFYAGYKLAELVHLVKLKLTLEKLLDSRGLSIDDVIATPENFEITVLEVEEVGDIKLLYDKEDNEFICQGTTLEELAVKFNERKKQSLGALQHNNVNVYFVNGKVKDKLST